MRYWTRTAFALALVAPAAHGQSPVIPAWPVASGSLVRVSAPMLGDKKQVGVVGSTSRDTLSFLPERGPAYLSIRTSHIREIEIHRGTHTRRLNGGLIGFVVGALSGAAVGAAAHSAPPPCTDFFGCIIGGALDSRSADAMLGAMLGGVLGAVAGTLVGGRAVDTWVPVKVPIT